jgi:hypothetical protein
MSTNSDTTTARAHITQIANKASAMNMGTSNARKHTTAPVLVIQKDGHVKRNYRIATDTLICVKMELEYVSDGTTMPEIAVG